MIRKDLLLLIAILTSVNVLRAQLGGDGGGVVTLACQDGQKLTGEVCTDCPAGTKPNSDNTACETCPVDTWSERKSTTCTACTGDLSTLTEKGGESIADCVSTSEDETRIEDPSIYGVHGKSNSNTRPSKAAKKPSIEQCRRWQESIENVLNDSTGQAHFMKFLRKEFASVNLDFWNAVKQLKKKNPQGDKLKRDVKQIFNIYISDHAATPIDLIGPLRRALMDRLSGPSVTLNVEMFDVVQEHVVQLMRDDAYKRFISEDNIQDILRGHG